MQRDWLLLLGGLLASTHVVSCRYRCTGAGELGAGAVARGVTLTDVSGHSAQSELHS